MVLFPFTLSTGATCRFRLYAEVQCHPEGSTANAFLFRRERDPASQAAVCAGTCAGHNSVTALLSPKLASDSPVV